MAEEAACGDRPPDGQAAAAACCDRRPEGQAAVAARRCSLAVRPASDCGHWGASAQLVLPLSFSLAPAQTSCLSAQQLMSNLSSKRACCSDHTSQRTCKHFWHRPAPHSEHIVTLFEALYRTLLVLRAMWMTVRQGTMQRLSTQLQCHSAASLKTALEFQRQAPWRSHLQTWRTGGCATQHMRQHGTPAKMPKMTAKQMPAIQPP